MADYSVWPGRDHPLRALPLDAYTRLEERIDGLGPGRNRDASEKQGVANQDHPERYLGPPHPAGVEGRQWDFGDEGREHDREHRAWCAEKGLPPAELNAILDDIEQLCGKLGVKIEPDEEAQRVYVYSSTCWMKGDFGLQRIQERAFNNAVLNTGHDDAALAVAAGFSA
jgi:hypothetical protein